ncbi:MAG: hypothetical protein JSV69_13190 [Chloroflexota bacterium]|nr:MAG: hypothetical protein JSV69_13190 [Chloroflexota bacterium]UCF28070.1 MAG: hypothetical protein JSW42_15855 [Chloroflexota bacterium]
MNTNFYLMKVIQNEKMEEYQDLAEQVGLTGQISYKRKETRIHKSFFVEKLLQLSAWLTNEIRSLRLSYR